MNVVSPYTPANKVRFLTATALFDGHDASINIIRRLLQRSGAEVIHLGHNRSVSEIVDSAIQEDVHAIAVSSYQGGHNEFFRYMIDLLKERHAEHVRVFAGGGGVIVPSEIEVLEAYGVTKVYSPEDGRRLTLQGIINDMLAKSDFPLVPIVLDGDFSLPTTNEPSRLARLITLLEENGEAIPESTREALARRAQKQPSPLRQGYGGQGPVVGVTGTGGAGKSSLTDELIRRLLADFRDVTVAVLSVDPTKRKTGGALLGDRIRMNAIHDPRVYVRSLATRGSPSELSTATKQAIEALRASGADVIFLETSGIGQGASGVADVADVSVYVMTADYGAPSQLEKIDMLDFADLVAINKFDRRGSEDALRDVRKQLRRNHHLPPTLPDAALPVYGTMASQFGDKGVSALYLALIEKLSVKLGRSFVSRIELPAGVVTGERQPILPEGRIRYLGEVAQTIRDERSRVESQVSVARKLYRLRGAIEDGATLEARFEEVRQKLDPESWKLIAEWPKLKEAYADDTHLFQVRGKGVEVQTSVTTLSGSRVPKVALPSFEDWGEILKFQLEENVPGAYPYTAGVYPFKRTEEDPRRQFAGEGGPERTNRRFHYLSRNDKAKRLSTAFDSVTLYGEDPDERPDIYGKIGEGGVAIATLDDMKKLYAGFDLVDPATSVSMTINGPAPAVLAMFFNTAVDQQVERFASVSGCAPSPLERERIAADTLGVVRGTVQADILKEDQAQNTCIFSTDFALRMMGDVQQYFIDRKIRNFYSVSISGYHIAEAGANPITQLAFTLANGFTYVEYYLARGMQIDDFAPNLSFFFSNGLDPEYSVMGRVARRIWARVMRLRYGANERSQKFKYHIQTSGRSLHAQEIQFNDVRTTLQALTAIYDNCNSLHTNSYDEAITTPTAESVRRAMAIQQIVTRELGMTKNENPLQGSYLAEGLTDLVEEAVLAEFDRLNSRGGVLGAMELQYQRSRIQEESLVYELKKDSGELPIVGVNTFLDPEASTDLIPRTMNLARATEEEKRAQIANLRAFRRRHTEAAAGAAERLKQVAREGGNLFACLMESVRVLSLGQITHALYEVGGQYRRSM